MDTPRPENGQTPEKDVPLRYDTRLLGRILGDTVRAQEGERVFDIREFGMQPPKILMLRVFPEVSVRVSIEATKDG